MKIMLLNKWESLRASFWFVPALMTVLAVALSFVTVYLDRTVAPDANIFGFIYSGGGEGARLVLSTIAGSMITVAGVTFSVTIVALTLASSQFGPRLLRNFMHDTGNQVVLGTFIANFAYCLLVVRTVRTVDGKDFVPVISVAFAIGLALAGIAVLIYFIHHVSFSMQAEQVISAVFKDLQAKMKRLFPEEKRDAPPESTDADNEANRQAEAESYPITTNIPSEGSGYLQAVNIGRLLKLAGENDLLVMLPYRPGDYIVEGITLIAVKCRKDIDGVLSRQLAASLILGPQRTPEQDAEFAVSQLVEIAVRALSPGINDPYTAMSCIDRLGSALCFLCGREFPSAYRYDENGSLRVISKPETFDDILHNSFSQIRRYGRSSASVAIRLMGTLELIAVKASDGRQSEAVLRQADMIMRDSRDSLPEPNDVGDVRQCYERLIKLVDKKGLRGE